MWRKLVLVGLVGVMALAPTMALAGPDGGVVGIEVLGNRADLLSGGTALVDVTLPEDADAAGLSADLDGRDVTDAFALRPNGRIQALLDGLVVGENVLTVSAPGARPAAITLTDHPIGGPVISGEQLQPWECTTADNGLGEPTDEQCNAPSRVDFFYRSTSRPGLQPYDPDDPPSDVATTTTDQGVEVPFIVRRERGTANRGIYDVAVLYDPSQPWTPWEPQSGWNGKLAYPFGASCGTEYTQGSPSGVLDEDTLAQGFAVANSSLNVLGDQCNTVISAEAVMMLKEHITETYGPIRYTIGSGCSGGSIGQQMVANGYPGLLDGIQPNCSYTDNWTTGLEVVDCHLLLHYFTQVSPHLWPVVQQQTEVMGHAAPSTCTAWEATFANRSDPDSGCSVPAEQRYDAEDNPDGVRCTLADYYAAVLGPREEDGFAKNPYDNIGWQYGLRALQSGLITAEQFVDLNEKIGGLTIDFEFRPERNEADPGAIETLSRAGQVNDAAQLDRVAIIDLRGSSNLEFHTDYHSWAMRDRLLRANGHADNHVIWTAQTPLVMPPSVSDEAFDVMDEWLAAVEADASDAPLEDKLVRNKPAAAVDACYVGTRRITDPSTCRTAFPYFGAPRIAAGAPISHDILKCQLAPLDRDAYAVEFTDEQWARLQAAFPEGVCDLNRPPARQERSIPWLSFADGPGGEPLGAPPASSPVEGEGAVAAAAAFAIDPGALPATGGGMGVGALAVLLAAGLSRGGRRGST